TQTSLFVDFTRCIRLNRYHYYFVGHLLSIFFFQAEDGIRDSSVTGVQTCALPISCRGAPPGAAVSDLPGEAPRHAAVVPGVQLRSEERRVGKGCRARWSPYCLRKRAADIGHRSASRDHAVMWQLLLGCHRWMCHYR